MAKVAAKNISNGMVFEVISHDRIVSLGFEQGNPMFGSPTVNPPIGSMIEIVKKPYKDGGIQMVDWKIVHSPEIWSSHWITFKTNTSYISGTLTPSTSLSITSTGRFSGFDVDVSKTQIEDYTNGMGYGVVTIQFDFLGSFTGGKKLPTKLINEIKKSPGFKNHLLYLIDKEFLKYKKEIDYLISNINSSALYFHNTYQDSKMRTWYSAGKLEFEIHIMDDLTKIKKEIDEQLDCFIALKKTNVGFLEK